MRDLIGINLYIGYSDNSIYPVQQMPTPDHLSLFIQQLSPQCEVFERIEFRAPWGVSEEQLNCCHFSYMTQGSCLLQVEGQEAVEMRAGQLLLLPYGTPHNMMSEQGIECQSATDIFGDLSREQLLEMSFGGDGEVCQLMCGYLKFSPFQFWGRETLNGGLPETILIDAPAGSQLEIILQWIYRETLDAKAGYQLATERLLELLLLELLRSLEHFETKPGWLRALSDRHLAPVMLTIQQRFNEEWSVESLADIAALSRSSFASRFKTVTGDTPLELLRQWRCLVVAQRLISTTDSVQQIARDCGFQSSDVLIRSFRQYHQQTPKQFRLRHSADV